MVTTSARSLTLNSISKLGSMCDRYLNNPNIFFLFYPKNYYKLRVIFSNTFGNSWKS